jgi:uncharacterized protein (DUF1697 family)
MRLVSKAAGQVSLLRGINVGGRNMIPMARLRAIYETMGLGDVRTHLQSGNVVFWSRRNPGEISAEVETAVHRELGLKIRVLGRTHVELGRVLRHDPFPHAEASRLIVFFLSARPPADIAERLRGAATAGEEIVVHGNELFLHYPDGQGRSKLTGGLVERGGIVATGRNWRTVARLHELTAPEG